MDGHLQQSKISLSLVFFFNIQIIEFIQIQEYFPGNGGIITLVVSCSKIFRKATKSLYLLRIRLSFLNAGMLVRQTIS